MRNTKPPRSLPSCFLLDRLYSRYHRVEFLGSDPLEFPHRYSDPWDREAVALLAAVLAYGNVKQIRRSVEAALERIHRAGQEAQTSPRAWVAGLSQAEGLTQARSVFKSFVHRFNGGTDIVILFGLLSRSWKEHGSLGAHFVSHLDPAAPDITVALNGLMADWRSWLKTDPALRALARSSPSHSYFLTAPSEGSCCKRWCMFLRWMGREERGSAHERLDLGLWAPGSELADKTFPAGKALHPSQLVIPLDTHTGRISQYIGLTRRKTLNWLAAREVTEALRLCDPQDPTKYDFALARLGILSLCRRSYRSEICSQCDLLEACRFARKGRARELRGARGLA
ncbi:MAG: TIGR02757 family protein [Oligoflexia bacterium]|nr:TIGR02757 family protein [Oligoflexia bacterium]